MGRGSRDDRDRDAGPPPQPANSRFAAADHEAERGNREREFAERGLPQQVTDSRFAAAAADHERESGTQERGDDRGGVDLDTATSGEAIDSDAAMIGEEIDSAGMRDRLPS